MTRTWTIGISGLALVSMLGASGCGGSSGGAGAAQNKDTEGAYAFSGANWVLDMNDINEDVWKKVGTDQQVVVDLQAGMTMSALDWAAGDEDAFHSVVTDAPITTHATSLDGTRAAWWIWDEDGVPVYEAYYVRGTTGVAAELSGTGVTMTDAQAILKSLVLLKDL